MTSPNSVFTELVTTTFRNHRKELADNVSQHNALLRRLNQKGRKRIEDGGLTIACPLDYAENSTYQRYSGYDPLDVSASDVLSAAEYQWRQVAVHVTASGLELRSNAGSDTRIINLVKSRVTNAIRSFKNGLSEDLYSSGTATNQINGLQAIISDAGTGTVGGINSSTFSFWLSTVQDADTPLNGGAAVSISSGTIEDLYLGLYIELTRGTDQPDLIVTANNHYEFYEKSQLAIKRYASSDLAKGGFVTLKYKNADVVHDGGSGIPTSRSYFLNTDFLEWVVHKDADMTEVPEMRSINQDATVIPIILQGNLVCSNRSLQGVVLP